MDDEDILTHKCDMCGQRIPFDKWCRNTNGHAKLYAHGIWSDRYWWDNRRDFDTETCGMDCYPSLFGRFIFWLTDERPRMRKTLGLKP